MHDCGLQQLNEPSQTLGPCVFDEVFPSVVLGEAELLLLFRRLNCLSFHAGLLVGL